MRRIRVLQVTHDLKPGGLPRVVDTLCRSLDPERFAVSVLCLRDLGSLAVALEEEVGTPCHLLPGGERTDYLRFLKVRDFLERHPVDLVHTHNTEPFFDGGVGAAMAGVRALVHTEHGRDWAATPLRWRVVERGLVRLASRVVAVSGDTATSMKRHMGVPEAKLRVIPNGIDGKRYDQSINRPALLESLGLPPDARIIGFASRLEPEKNLGAVVRALPTILQEVPEAHLVVAGYGSQKELLEALARELGVQDRTLFLGVRSDIPALLKLFDVHVLPSLREGLPMILLEAMAAGCPTVATAVGGIPEVIGDGWNGVLVEGGTSSIERAVTTLLTDTGRRQRISQAGKVSFRQLFDASRMAASYQGIYHAALRTDR